MGQQFSLARKGSDVVEMANALIRDGHTIDEIRDKLAELGTDVSRSAVGRYVKSAKKSMQQYMEAQAIAGQWMSKLKDDPESDVGRLCAEMLRMVSLNAIGAMTDSDSPADAQQIMHLSTALKNLDAASKLKLEIEVKLRDMRTRAAAADKKVAALSKEGKVMPEQAALIRAAIKEIIG
jgi:hypothetical protein